ncbi:hypothetical protein, partial [Mesorhizobium sp.]|uniref:hypothetical protein n=1 Tax=Mesorhizobium sp. TaxID=1871066 RepID=UPI00257F5219
MSRSSPSAAPRGSFVSLAPPRPGVALGLGVGIGGCPISAVGASVFSAGAAGSAGVSIFGATLCSSRRGV